MAGFITMSIQMKKDSLIRKLFNFFLKNWIISSIISVIPILVSVIVDFWLPIDCPSWCKYLLTGFVAVSVLFTVIKNKCTSVDDNKRQKADKYFQSLTQRNIGTTGNLIEDVVNVIIEKKYNNIVNVPIAPFCNDHSRISPYSKIKRYCDDVITILAKHFDATEDDIGISIYIKNTIDNGPSARWEFLYHNSVITQDLSAASISQNAHSAFFVVQDSPGSIYFKEKKNALIEKHYVKTTNEESGDVTGNIYCENISLVDGEHKVLLPIIFCVTTYRTRICSDKDYFAVEKAEKLLSKIGVDIKYEIAQLLLFKSMGIREKLY